MAELDSGTRNAVHTLHKGLGVRGHGRLLALLFTTRLGELWGITRDEPESVIRAKVIYRLRQELRKVLDEAGRRAGETIYNLFPDPEMHELNLGQRQDRLRKRHPGEKYSKRSMSRLIETLGEMVEQSLRSSLPEIPEAALLSIMRSEAEFTDEQAGRIGPDAFARLVRKSYTAAMDDATAAFLRLPVLVPKSQTDDLIIARTPNLGDWLCVFSTEEIQRAHHKATPQQPWSGHCGRVLGAELVRDVTNRWTSVGILVDPPATRSDYPTSDTARALRLPPSELLRLTAT